MSDNQSPRPEPKQVGSDDVDFRLLLICHAEEMQNRYANLASSDSGLTAVGWQQTDVLANWLRSHYRLHALFSGPELRNRLTAQRVGQSLGLPVTIYEELFQPSDPIIELELAEAAIDVASDSPCLDLQNVLEPLIEKYTQQAVAMFMSRHAIELTLACLLGVEDIHLRLLHTSVSELQCRDGEWYIAYINRREHLPQPIPDDIVPVLAEEKTPDLPEDLSLLPQIYNQDVAASVDQNDSSRLNRFANLISFADIQAGARVLDVGTGTGLLSMALAESCDVTVVGTDISPAMLERAEFFRLNSPHEIARRVNFRLATAQALPFAKGRFDVVICRMVLHLNRKPERILRELWRVLRPGGILIIADLLSTEDPVRRATQNAIEERRNPSHVAAYSVAQYREMITQAGFVPKSEEIAIFSRKLDEWLAELGAKPANGAVVREMVEASLGNRRRRYQRPAPWRRTDL